MTKTRGEATSPDVPCWLHVAVARPVTATPRQAQHYMISFHMFLTEQLLKVRLRSIKWHWLLQR